MAFHTPSCPSTPAHVPYMAPTWAVHGQDMHMRRPACFARFLAHISSAYRNICPPTRYPRRRSSRLPSFLVTHASKHIKCSPSRQRTIKFASLYICFHSTILLARSDNPSTVMAVSWSKEAVLALVSLLLVICLAPPMLWLWKRCMTRGPQFGFFYHPVQKSQISGHFHANLPQIQLQAVATPVYMTWSCLS
jgi:hypothetical protein